MPISRPGALIVALGLVWGACADPTPSIRRFVTNPLITPQSSPSLGDNINGPSVIRVPDWVEAPLGRFYLYFSHHRGEFIRMAYADQLEGPWHIYEPGVLHVRDTAFYRPQPDTPVPQEGMFTHIASPDVVIDPVNRQIQLWYHGWWTANNPWPLEKKNARAWATQHRYEQYTQVALSRDGLHFTPQEGLTEGSYLRLFQHQGGLYALGRAGELLRGSLPLGPLVRGPDPFVATPHSGQIRHVALLHQGDLLRTFYSVVGDKPERIWMSNIQLQGDWSQWRATAPVEILRPQAGGECVDLPLQPSRMGPPPGPVHQVRDPAILQDAGHTYLFYSICGELGIAAAELNLPPP